MHPYFRAIVDAYASSGRPFFHQSSPADARAMLRAGQLAAPKPQDLPTLASVTEDKVGDVAVRRYLPTGKVLGSCVFCHAGGWVIGDLDTAESLCRRLAAGSGCEVISVDYRLAPEHCFPAPLDDVYAVIVWAASLGRPLVVAGESAGANLVTACAIRARDENGPHIHAQFLSCPVTDHDFETASYVTLGAKNFLLSRADMQWFWNHYCPPGIDRSNPLISPLRVASAKGLPPTFLLVAELDPLRDEGLAYAALLQRDGVPVIVKEGEGMLHGYTNAAGAIPQVAQTVAEAAGWLRGCLTQYSQALQNSHALRAGGKLAGRRILITGAASGMGRATAELFEREGARVALLDRNVEGVTELASTLGAFAFACDITSSTDVGKCVDEAVKVLGGLDGIVNAAGVFLARPFEEIDSDSWNRVITTNLNGPYYVVQAALSALRRAPLATIVNIASVSGYLPMAGTSVYSASKAAVIMLTKCLALELGPTIRANAICPGVIRTEMTRHIWQDQARAASTADRVALKKIGTPEEIANAALYLSSGDSGFTTGTEIVVDGGFSWR